MGRTDLTGEQCLPGDGNTLRTSSLSDGGNVTRSIIGVALGKERGRARIAEKKKVNLLFLYFFFRGKVSLKRLRMTRVGSEARL